MEKVSDNLLERIKIGHDSAYERGWQEAIEAAAQACEARVEDGYRYGNREAEQCAIAIRSLRPSPEQGAWKCKARASNMGANDPQDCDWPVCGCDPYADKVIEALQESGKLK